MLKFSIHYSLHFIAPFFIAYFFFKKRWKKVYLIFLCSMLIDLDHLLADPIFDANRCSINYHPLHSYYAIAIYSVMLIPKRTRIFAIGLIAHIISDSVDCFLI